MSRIPEMIAAAPLPAAPQEAGLPVGMSYFSGRSFFESTMAFTMNDSLPDRLSIDPTSPFHDAEVLQRDVGIRFNGKEKTNVEEYCVSEGWIRVAAGTAKDRRGNPMTLKLKGKVEPYFRDGEEAPSA